MVNEPEIQAFITKLTEIYRELAEVNEKLETYRQRKKELEEIINECKAIFRVDRLLSKEGRPLSQSSFPLSPTTRRPTRSKSMRASRGKQIIWQLVEGLMREMGPTMKFKQIRKIGVERGWITDDANGIKILYRAMSDKAKEGKVFVQIDRETWGLKEHTM